MKIKPAPETGGVLLELGPEESQLPAQNLPPAPAFTLKTILVPVDFSDCSKKALQYAIPFAKQFGAELRLLHVVEPCPAVPDMVPMEGEAVPVARRQLELLRHAVDHSVRSSASLCIGVPQFEIVRAARELGADLIVLATHGHAGLSRVLLGSTTEKVVRHAPCPVLVVRESEREFVPDTPAPAAP